MPKTSIKSANKRKIQQRQAIDDVLLNAQECFKEGYFTGAILQYGLLVRLLEQSKFATPDEKGDAYWNLAMSNIERANQLTDQDVPNADLYYAQARLQVRQALLTYKDKNEIKACQEKLVELGDPTIKVELPIEDFAVKVEKPPVLHWKKILLQRFQEEQAAANVECTMTAATSKRLT
ncbi:MAG: hypothetical protein AB7I18_01175 [Candidatus Berkiella sp.]